MKILKNLNFLIISLVIAFPNSTFANNQNDDDPNPYPVLILGIGFVIYSATLETQRKKDAFKLINNLYDSQKLKNDRISLKFFPLQTNKKISFEDYFNLERKLDNPRVDLLEIKMKLN